MAALNR